MNKFIVTTALGVALAGLSLPANAAVVLTSIPGTDPYSGPAPTYDFETPAPVVGGAIRNGDIPNIAAQPFGSTGNYLAAGPGNNGSAVLSLADFGSISQFSFLWGSVDGYNVLDILDRLGGVLFSFDGNDAAINPNGDQSSPATNRVAYFNVTGADRSNIGGLRFSANQNAFEVDNVAVQSAVPEPSTWLMLILGFGLVGTMLRTSGGAARTTRRVRFAF